MSEQELRAMGVSPGLSAAYDRLLLCHLAEKQGRCPEAFARHLVTLCKAVTEPKPGSPATSS